MPRRPRGDVVAPASARRLLSRRATKLQWLVFFATARDKRHESAQECHDGDFLALHGYDLRLAALLLGAPLCPMPINAQGSIAIPARKSVDKTRMPRDLRTQTRAILPPVANQTARSTRCRAGARRVMAGQTAVAMRSQRSPRCAVPGMCRGRWASAAPGAAHALADALRTVDDTAGRNEAAHPAGEGRQAPAIGAVAAEIAGANHLAVATDIEARGLRQDGRSGQPCRTAGEQRQQPVAQPSHAMHPKNTVAEA